MKAELNEYGTITIRAESHAEILALAYLREKRHLVIHVYASTRHDPENKILAYAEGYGEQPCITIGHYTGDRSND